MNLHHEAANIRDGSGQTAAAWREAPVGGALRRAAAVYHRRLGELGGFNRDKGAAGACEVQLLRGFVRMAGNSVTNSL